MEKQLVTVYSLCFKGVFGRNRSAKFECTREKELDVTTQHLVLPAELDAWLGEIKAKKGLAFVVVYNDTEVSEFESGGVTQRGYVIPITNGVRVCAKDVG
jgi:hypothetical protein